VLAKRASRAKPRVENAGYWMSYSDMMAALLLMFVLLLFLSFNRYVMLQKTKEDELAAKEAQLIERQAEADDLRAALDKREQELITLSAVLNTEQLKADQQQLELNSQSAALVKSQQELEQSLAQLILQQKQIEDQEALLKLSQEEIDNARAQLDAMKKDLDSRQILLSAKDAELIIEQLRVADLETLLNQQKAELETQAQRIDELVGVRARIIAQLRDAFANEGLNVAVDRNTGAITMDSTVFFDTDQTYIKPEGRALLLQFLPVYFRTLMSQENAEYVGEIIIEGHTDSDGSYEHNLELSQRRAQAVVTFCMSDGFPGLTAEEKLKLRSMITANGRSESQLIYDAYGNEDKAASRRVEIKFRLQDAEMIESLSRILSQMGN